MKIGKRTNKQIIKKTRKKNEKKNKKNGQFSSYTGFKFQTLREGRSRKILKNKKGRTKKVEKEQTTTQKNKREPKTS